MRPCGRVSLFCFIGGSFAPTMQFEKLEIQGSIPAFSKLLFEPKSLAANVIDFQEGSIWILMF